MAPKGTQVVSCGTFEPRPQPCHSPLSPRRSSSRVAGNFSHKNKFKDSSSFQFPVCLLSHQDSGLESNTF